MIGVCCGGLRLWRGLWEGVDMPEGVWRRGMEVDRCGVLESVKRGCDRLICT